MSGKAILLSGGMDSIALSWGCRPDLAITIDYGQRAAEGEIRAAKAACEYLSIPQAILRIDCSSIGSGDMVGSEPSPSAPVPEWWPFRNQLLITMAAAKIVDKGINTLLFGSVQGDGTHADGRIEFFQKLTSLLEQQEGSIQIEVPGITHTTVSLCQSFDVPFELLAYSHSCHVAEYACGLCRGCMKHRLTMRELGYGEY